MNAAWTLVQHISAMSNKVQDEIVRPPNAVKAETLRVLTDELRTYITDPAFQCPSWAVARLEPALESLAWIDLDMDPETGHVDLDMVARAAVEIEFVSRHLLSGGGEPVPLGEGIRFDSVVLSDVIGAMKERVADRQAVSDADVLRARSQQLGEF